MKFLNSQKIIVILLLSMMAIIGKTFVKSLPTEQQSTRFGNYTFQKSDKQNFPTTLTTDIAEVDRGEEDLHSYTDFTSTLSHLNDFKIGFTVMIKPVLVNSKFAQFIPNQKRNILYCSFLI